MAKRKLTEEEQKEIDILRASNQMLTNTLIETKERKKDQSTKLIENAIAENNDMIKAIDPSMVTNFDTNYKNNSSSFLEDGDDVSLIDMNSGNYEEVLDMKEESSITEKTITNNIEQSYNEMLDAISSDEVKDEILDMNVFDVKKTDLQYDVIPLPSNGECYKSKTSRLSVAFLTAESENLITSPHLYKDDMIVDALLKYHVLNKNFDVDDLVSGDVDAIMLWLRATGYGNDYPLVVREPETGEEFEAMADLSKIEIKKFTLKGDENGWFDFDLPVSKVTVKFKYLTRKEEKKLLLLNKMENDNLKGEVLKQSYKSIVQCYKNDKMISNADKRKIEDSLKTIFEWINKPTNNASKQVKINHLITNRLMMSIMAVDGNTDKKFIMDFVRRMPALDSLRLRQYMEENKPGVDWNIKIDKPQSLGGGSVDMFLEWGADAFLNI